MKSILIYDENCGWSPSLNASKGTGGTEVHLVQIASWLADLSGDYAVAVMCHDGKGQQENGVWYHESRDANVKALFDVIITVRKSRIPSTARGAMVLTLVTDDPRPCPGDFAHLLGRSTLVCVSEWQAGLYRALGHQCVVIPAMIDDSVYGLRGSARLPGRVACLSAWNKGTQATLDAWVEMATPFASLIVGSPYSHPDDARERCRAAGAIWIGTLTPRDVVAHLYIAETHFRVCTIGETFGATDALAEALGCVPCVYCPNEVGALQETLSHRVFLNRQDWEMALNIGPPFPARPERDFRVSKIMPMWLDLLNDEP